MATSRDEIIGEVWSKSGRKLGLQSRQIAKGKYLSPKIIHIDPSHHQLQGIPLTDNLTPAPWNRRCRRPIRFLNYPLHPPPTLSNKDPASQSTAIVQLRHCFPEGRIHTLIIRIGRFVGAGTFKRSKRVENGLDTYFNSDNDAMAYFNLLCSRLPIRPDKLTKTPTNGSYITAMVCPISPDDLIYLRSNTSSRTLMLCIGVSNSISLLDPLTLSKINVSAVEYWTEPTIFEIYKSVKDFVEYIVLDVTHISKEGFNSLSKVDVARVADFGKNDIVFTTMTHMGYLKPGDRVFGYDLYGTNTDETKESLLDVVLVRKDLLRTRTVVDMKNIRSEYETFLRDLEKNSEAMFNLSLNGENNNSSEANKQQLGMNDSMVEGKDTGFGLEELLADLALGDQQDVGAPAPGRSDELHRS